ncbi:MAG: hypothetical protein JWP27_1538 [Flaviaesturariibacter sp.]|nr:hypothetical protein [Flaviaesturariibacter sp.]
MRRILLVLFLVVFFGAVVIAWIVLGSGTGFSEHRKALYIGSNAATREAVLDSLRARKIIRNETAFLFLANRLGYWDKIRPGKYEFSKGTSLLSIVRALRNGSQTPVKLSFSKLRTREDLARLVGSHFECDSAAMMRFLSSPDSLRSFDVTPEQAMTLVFPDTYTYNWNTTPRRIYRKLADVAYGFWSSDHTARAKALGLSKGEAYTLASIVEEETNASKEKGTIASVYLNRLHKGMALGADPTIKFALHDFTLKRIYEKHLAVVSPYNTYRNKGLPPGPICTPSRKTLEAVLNAPQTDFLFFVASPSFDGTHEFSATYPEHLAKARAYQQELDRQQAIRDQSSNPSR